MTNSEQAKIDIYLSQPVVKIALDMLSLKYDFVVDELAKSIFEEEIDIDEAADFLVEDFDFDNIKAIKLIDSLSENVIEPFYLEPQDSAVIDNIEDQAPELAATKVSNKETNWKDFIRPKVLNIGMEELGKAASGDVARIRNYLWKNLGLGKPEEVVIVLSWLATTGELVKLWQEDNRFKGILKKYISLKYSDNLAETVMSDNISPALLALALKMILEDKLSLSSQDAAMISMSIIDQMSDEDKPKYILVSYVDAKDNTFNWNKIQESASGLQLAI